MTDMTPRRTPRVFPILTAVAALLLAAPVYAQADRSDRAPVPVLRASGEAEVSAEPDIATFTVGAEIRDPSASRAMAEAARVTEGLVAALRKLGIPRENIQTVQLSLQDIQEPENPQPVNTREVRYRRVYVATHVLQVEVGRDRFTRIGEILDAAIKAGANHVGSVTFGIRDDAPLRKEGLARAVRNAREKADVMAAAAGATIRGILTLQEGSIPRPMPYYEAADTRGMAMMSAPSPVAPSQIRRTYHVTVEYRIDG